MCKHFSVPLNDTLHGVVVVVYVIGMVYIPVPPAI